MKKPPEVDFEYKVITAPKNVGVWAGNKKREPSRPFFGGLGVSPFSHKNNEMLEKHVFFAPPSKNVLVLLVPPPKKGFVFSVPLKK